MTKSQIRAWCAALRSEKYKQGTGDYMHQDRTYSSFGVLIEVMEGSDVWADSGFPGRISVASKGPAKGCKRYPTCDAYGLSMPVRNYLRRLECDGVIFHDMADRIEEIEDDILRSGRPKDVNRWSILRTLSLRMPETKRA